MTVVYWDCIHHIHKEFITPDLNDSTYIFSSVYPCVLQLQACCLLQNFLPSAAEVRISPLLVALMSRRTDHKQAAFLQCHRRVSPSPGPWACEAEPQNQTWDLSWLKAESTKTTKRWVVPAAQQRAGTRPEAKWGMKQLLSAAGCIRSI